MPGAVLAFCRGVHIRIALVLLVFAACGAEPDVGAEEAPIGEETLQGGKEQGGREQGTDLVIEGTRIYSATLGGNVIDPLRIDHGQLIATQGRPLTGTTASLTACPAGTTTTGLARSCGWKSLGVGTCTPGASLSISLGACGQGFADPMLRVCSGTAPCEYSSSARIATNDNACSTKLPRVVFACPASGTFSAMVSSFTPNTAIGYSVYVASATFPAMQTLRGTQLTPRLEPAHADLR